MAFKCSILRFFWESRTEPIWVWTDFLNPRSISLSNVNSRKPVRDVGVTYFFNSCSERRSLGKSWIFKRFVLTLRNKLIAKDLLILRFKPEFEDGGFERRYRRQLDIVCVDQPTLVQSLNQLGDLLSDDRLQHCIFGLSELWLPSQDILHHLSDSPRHE